MKSLWLKKKMKYNGAQLRPLFAFENYNIAGNSIISWLGPCDVSLDHMVDFEDKIVDAKIKSNNMLHFIIEFFNPNLFGAVALQRLFCAMAKDIISKQLNDDRVRLFRSGDDIYWGKKKLSISIASISVVSSQIHFAFNVSNLGAPVEICSLIDFKIEPKKFAKDLMKAFSLEFKDIEFATQKVKPL